MNLKTKIYQIIKEKQKELKKSSEQYFDLIIQSNGKEISITTKKNDKSTKDIIPFVTGDSLSLTFKVKRNIKEIAIINIKKGNLLLTDSGENIEIDTKYDILDEIEIKTGLVYEIEDLFLENINFNNESIEIVYSIEYSGNLFYNNCFFRA